MIREALAAYAAANARAFEDRAQTIGASDVGQCARKVFWSKMEGDPEYGAARDPEYADGWGATVRGTVFENHFWLPAMRARFGERLRFAGEQQETFALGFLSGTPDGLLTALDSDALAPLGIADLGGDGSLVVECKTIDPRAKLDGPRLEHAFQAQVQLGLLHALTSHRPEYALISYADASFWDLVYEFSIRRDPAIFAVAQQRARTIMLARTAEGLKPEGWIAGGAECNYCPFTRACGRARTAVPGTDAEADPQLAAKLVDTARATKQAEMDADSAGAKLRELQHELKERMRAHGLRRVAADGVRITWSAIKGRPSYDMKRIREDAAKVGINLAEYETTGDATDRLVIQVAERSCPAA
jgi:hypothetical protein